MVFKHVYGNSPKLFGVWVKWDEIITLSQWHWVLSVSFVNIFILSNDT